MSEWKKLYVQPDVPMGRAIAVLDGGNTQICLVVDADEILVGTITDGDIRRGLLRGLPMETPVAEIMSRAPVVGDPSLSREAQRHLMLSSHVRQLPIVGPDGRVMGLTVLDDVLAEGEAPARDNLVVLMAGGYGTRLSPLTDEVPKPLLRVAGKPMLERILEGLVAQGFERFLISINYKAEMVKSHFGDGHKWGVEIAYLEEDEALGTAGALSLIDPRPTAPLLVMNGDVLTAVNFENLLDFHAGQGAVATMCVRTYDFQIPFGVVNTKNMVITSIDEKPEHQFLVNAGIYVLENWTLDLIPAGQRFDMPDLFNAMIAKGHEATVFPIREYWIDVGRMEDFRRANHEVVSEVDGAVIRTASSE